MSNELAAAPPIRSRRRNRNWLWVFATLMLLALLAAGINWAWNSMQPLTPERLRDARALWKEKRPPDYDLKIARTVMYESSDGTRGTIVDKYFVQVRGGKVVGFQVNGKDPEPLLNRDGGRNGAEEQRQKLNYDIDGLFDAIEEFMAIDQRENRKSFLRARFNKDDGHLMLFSRQLDGRRNPYIQVDLKRVN